MKVAEGSAPLYNDSTLLKKVAGLGLGLPDDLSRIAAVRGLRYYDVRNEMAELQQEARLRNSVPHFLWAQCLSHATVVTTRQIDH